MGPLITYVDGHVLLFPVFLVICGEDREWRPGKQVILKPLKLRMPQHESKHFHASNTRSCFGETTNCVVPSTLQDGCFDEWSHQSFQFVNCWGKSPTHSAWELNTSSVYKFITEYNSREYLKMICVNLSHVVADVGSVMIMWQQGWVVWWYIPPSSNIVT